MRAGLASLRLAALALPLFGLAGLWAASERAFRAGTEWEVPIAGYDPRDMLRGHYVEFAYDWPGLALTEPAPESLCLEGAAPAIADVRVPEPDEDCAHPLRAAPGGVYGWQGLVRGRLYVGQERAAALEEQLRDRDRRGIVTIRLREDGSFTPVAIRFRPLTPGEITARDAPPAGPETTGT